MTWLVSLTKRRNSAFVAGVGVDPEAVDLDAMRRLLLGIMVVRAHGELAAGNEHHLSAGLDFGLGAAGPLDLARDTHAAPRLGRLRRGEDRLPVVLHVDHHPAFGRCLVKRLVEFADIGKLRS